MELTLDEALQKGIGAQRAGQTKEADELYTLILKAQPKHPDANHNLGVLAVSVGKLQEALPLFKTALETNPSIGQFWLSYIDALIKLGQITDAKAVFSQAKDKGASGQVFDQLEKQLYELDAYPQDPSSEQLQPIISLFTQGQLRQAVSDVNEMLETFPHSAILYNISGASNAGLMQFDSAVDSYKKALKVKPDFAEVHNNMGNALKAKGDLDAAIYCFKRALNIKPDYAVAYNNMGIVLADNGELDAAIDSYNKAIKIKPDYHRAYYHLGLLLFESKQYEKAAENFKLSDVDKSKYHLLRCLFLQDKQTLFYDQLDCLIHQGDVHPMLGSLGCRSALKYGLERPNLFCKDPLNYVLKTDLSHQYDFGEIFVKTARTILEENRVPIRLQSLLTNGKQTAGNLFSFERDLTADIEKIIRLEIDKYQANFKDSKEGLITSWPSGYSINGWLVSMKSGGQLQPHMHEKGWLSGSIYINVPSKSKADSGNLVVCIEEKELESENGNQEKSIDVVTGSLCLFPASLLHYTIPFESDEERIVLAFDVVPEYEEN